MAAPPAPPAEADARAFAAPWQNDPAGFCRAVLGVSPEPWQQQALQAVQANDRIAIRSGHGVGKSALLAWLVLWFLSTRSVAKIPCTAPTAHQLLDILWGEIAKWRRRARTCGGPAAGRPGRPHRRQKRPCRADPRAL